MSEGRKFVMFFEEKEGTTAIIRLLGNFEQVHVVHARGEPEPFDRHTCGPMSVDALRECLDLVFAGAPPEEINEVYGRTANRRLSPVRTDGSFGFKMRFKPPYDPAFRGGNADVLGGIPGLRHEEFREAMLDVLARHRVLVLLAVRQNVLRWALSKYHGDGTGKPGHLQFKLAKGALAREEIPRITVDVDELQREIDACETLHDEKRELTRVLRAAGIDVVPVRYEDFVADAPAFFRDLLATLEHDVTDADVRPALERGVRLERVHGDDLSEFFLNADEVLARFPDRYDRWA